MNGYFTYVGCRKTPGSCHNCSAKTEYSHTLRFTNKPGITVCGSCVDGLVLKRYRGIVLYAEALCRDNGGRFVSEQYIAEAYLA
jgi:hypothetical protein